MFIVIYHIFIQLKICGERNNKLLRCPKQRFLELLNENKYKMGYKYHTNHFFFYNLRKFFLTLLEIGEYYSECYNKTLIIKNFKHEFYIEKS